MKPIFSLPSAFEDSMQRQLGNEFVRFRDCLNDKAPVSVRLNEEKKNQLSCTEDVPWCNTGKYLHERPVFTLDPFFHAGSYYVQEASSMFLEVAVRQLVDCDEPLNVLDLCAAPGGKSTHMLSLLNRRSLLVSNEVIRPRASILAENITKWGYSNVIVTSNDPEDFHQYPDLFDVVVVDAPCSGEGLFRKDPEAMREWSPETVDLCARRQRRILSGIWPSIREGGILIYSTCTYNRRENDDNVRWLLDEFDAEACLLQYPTSWNIVPPDGSDGMGYRFYPHRVKGEGFFLAAVRKTSPSGKFIRPQKRPTYSKPSRPIVQKLSQWINAEQQEFLQFRDTVHFFPAAHLELLNSLASHLRVVQSGTAAATIKGDKLIPEHGLALSVDLKQDQVDHLELTREEALQFLRRESLPISSADRGYALVTYENTPLGWVNRLGNRVNNLYPVSARIRMQV